MNTPKVPHFVVCVKIPQQRGIDGLQTEEWSKWHTLLSDNETNPKPNGVVQMPAENIWLIPIESGIGFYKRLVSAFDRHKVDYSIFYLDDAPRKCKAEA
jgi:hypothetical protein